jgi:hypothetical protein
VDAITLAQNNAEDIYSPYFFLSVDVYHQGSLPAEEARAGIFKNPLIFESNILGTKDRFLLGDIPVRIEYKSMERIDSLLDQAHAPVYPFKENGTYPFYRLQHNTLLYSRSGWLEKIHGRLTKLPASFWDTLIQRGLANLEHLNVDICAAAVVQDDLFHLRSLAAFVNTVCSLLFLINHQFEPSGRRLVEKLYALPVLPESFKGRFECLIKNDPDFDLSRKGEIATVLTKNLLSLC